MDQIPNYGDPASYDINTHYPRPLSPPSGQYDEDEELIEEEIQQEEEPYKPTVWEEISEEYEAGRRLYEEAKKLANPDTPVPSDYDQASAYTIREIFPTLLPAMEATLAKAHEWDCLRIQKCRFSGLDYIAEVLWNKNPQHDRGDPWLDIYNIPFAKEWLKNNPRPLFPMSWLWSPEEAALIIQSAVRAFLVRKRDDVQEMRQFWKVLAKEKEEERQEKLREENERKAAEREVIRQDVHEMLETEALGCALSIERVKEEQAQEREYVKQEIQDMLQESVLKNVVPSNQDTGAASTDNVTSSHEWAESRDVVN